MGPCRLAKDGPPLTTRVLHVGPRWHHGFCIWARLDKLRTKDGPPLTFSFMSIPSLDLRKLKHMLNIISYPFWVLFWMPSRSADTKEGGARKTQTHVITWQKQNHNNKIQHTCNRDRDCRAHATRLSKQQTKTNILYTVETKKKLFLGLIWDYRRLTLKHVL